MQNQLACYSENAVWFAGEEEAVEGSTEREDQNQGQETCEKESRKTSFVQKVIGQLANFSSVQYLW